LRHESAVREPASDRARKRFGELVLPHLDDAYGLARWLTGQRADAEDVVQEACLRALAALETAIIEQPRAWLLGIVRNTAFTWLAKNRPKAVLVTDDERLFEAAARSSEASPNAEEAMIAAADEAALHQAIAALPLPFKEVLVMRDISGLSYREIALAAGSPIGTVMSRLARARAILVAKLTRPE
jgi:RNA polymerase sigma factor (sigma-70 family)